MTARASMMVPLKNQQMSGVMGEEHQYEV
jgi:hypothetical protein